MAQLNKEMKSLLKSAIAKLDEAKTDLESLTSLMTEYHDERSEKWQESASADEWNDTISGIEDYTANVEDAFYNLSGTLGERF